jgi:cyclophilin family peptidyl-prolyl cis-trans isomerase
MATAIKEVLVENRRFLLLFVGLLVISFLVMFFLSTGLLIPNNISQQEDINTYKSPQNVLEDDTDYIIVVKTSYGDIYIDLYEQEAYANVNSLLFLIGERYYEDLTFYKVIKQFVVQTGDTKGDGTGNPGYSVEEENLLPFSDYDVGMANASQFFIVLPGFNREQFDGKYSLVGKVIAGFVVLDSMEKAQVDDNYRPLNDILINSIQIHEE